jgi:predicted nucleotidyltransferase
MNSMHLEILTQRLQETLCDEHGCHTVILYGSRARGDATGGSDVDVLGIRESGDPLRIGRLWHGLLLDAWIYADSNLPPLSEMIHIEGGIVLRERADFGSALLAKIEDEVAKPTQPLSADEREHRATWMKKMVSRAARGDVEGHYRRHWLLYSLLEDWFAFSCLRYRGPKESFAYLKQHCPEVHEEFQRALNPNATLRDIERLVDVIVGL